MDIMQKITDLQSMIFSLRTKADSMQISTPQGVFQQINGCVDELFEILTLIPEEDPIYPKVLSVANKLHATLYGVLDAADKTLQACAILVNDGE